MMTYYISDTGNVFMTDEVNVFAVGTAQKTETIRIDSETVEDVSYTFDIELGDYVEQSREQRNLPDPDGVSPVDAKIAELNAACNASILAGFNSDALGSDNTYDFGYDDQINLGGMLNAVTAGIVTGTIIWKASGAPQPHTIEQFKSVFAAGLVWKNSNIEKYWTLKAEVYAATTTEEIEAIHW